MEAAPQLAKSGGGGAKRVVKLAAEVLLLVGVLLLVWVGWGAVVARKVQVGALVSTSFSGNPAAIRVALVGAEGDQWTQVDDQDAANALRCDVPGAAGTASSWLSNGGVDWATRNPRLCTASVNNWWADFTCTQDSDCWKLPSLPCGSAVSGYSAVSGTAAQCGAGSKSDGSALATCSDPTSGTCVLTEPAQIDVSCTSVGKCHMTSLPPGTCPFISCTPGDPSPCFEGQSCSTDASGLPITLAPGEGFCDGVPTPHISMNLPMVAEGSVTAVNTDGSVDVAWSRVAVRYGVEGPAPGWRYSDCRFVADAGDNGLNATASQILLGGTSDAAYQTGSTITSSGGGTFSADPLGFAWVASDTAYSLTNATVQLDGVLPFVAGGVGASDHVAWNLQSHAIPVARVTRILRHSIANLPVTSASRASWTSLRNIALENGAGTASS